MSHAPQPLRERAPEGGAGSLLIRICDVALACAGLVLAAPLFLVVIPLLRFSGEGEIFYRQTRIGRGGRPFGLIKFATMQKDSARTGAGELTLPGDARVLPVGQVLRKTKINELPQLLNVLSGDLSVIGPRPQTERYFLAFSPETRELIASVRPGLSGVGSVIFRNEEGMLALVDDPVAFDELVIMPYKGEIEAWYVKNRSPALYLELIGLTAAAILFPHAAVHRGLLERLPPPPPALAPLISGPERISKHRSE